MHYTYIIMHLPNISKTVLENVISFKVPNG